MVLLVSIELTPVWASDPVDKVEVTVLETGEYELTLGEAVIEPQVIEEMDSLSLVKVGDDLATLSTSQPTSKDTVVAFANGEETILSWNFADESENVTISYDDVLIDKNAQGSLNLGDLSGTPTQITVLQEIEDPTDSSLVNYTAASLISLQPEETTLTSYASTVLAAVALPSTSTFRYQTFIANQYVRAPLLGCEYADMTLVSGYTYLFGGNNRYFSAGSSNNKTLMNVVLNWGTSSMQLTKYVQITSVYKSSELGGIEFVESKTAPSSGINIYNLGMTSSTAKFSMVHNAANPYCAVAKGIEYSLSVTAQRTGAYTISGWFRQVPSHEFYYKDSIRTSWETIFQSNLDSSLGFDCLNPFGQDCKITGNWSNLTTTYYPG